MDVKKTGSDWTGSATIVGRMATNGVRTPFSIFSLKLLDFPSFRTSHPRPHSVFRDFLYPQHAALDIRGHANLAQGKAQVELTAIARNTYLGIPRIPQMLSNKTFTLVPNWPFIAQGYLDFVDESRARHEPLGNQHFWMRMEHPWHTTIVVDVLSDVPKDISLGVGFLLVDSTSTAFVEFEAGGNGPDGDVYTLNTFKKPQRRRYIVSAAQLFEHSHPMAKLCFTQGLFAHATYYAEGDQAWRRGAQYSQLAER